VYSGANDGIPDIPQGTGTGAGDLDEVFNKSLGDFDGQMEGERGTIASTGSGSAKGADQRERGDADAVANGSGGMSGSGSMPSAGSGDVGGAGNGSVSGAGTGGMAGSSGGSDASGAGGAAGDGGGGIGGGDQPPGGGDTEESDRDGSKVAKLPDDIPVDGSGDDVVGRQIREAAIAMQDSNPEAAEKLWDEYRKHTGIK
jgi:hypothetical protein